MHDSHTTHDTQTQKDRTHDHRHELLTDVLRDVDPEEGSYVLESNTILYTQGCDDETIGHLRRSEWTVSLDASVEADHPELVDALEESILTVEVQSPDGPSLAARLSDVLGDADMRVDATRGEGRIVVWRDADDLPKRHLALGQSDRALWLEGEATASEAATLRRACAALEVELDERYAERSAPAAE